MDDCLLEHKHTVIDFTIESYIILFYEFVLASVVLSVSKLRCIIGMEIIRLNG